MLSTTTVVTIHIQTEVVLDYGMMRLDDIWLTWC